MEILSVSFFGSVLAESLCFLLCFVIIFMWKLQKHSASKAQYAAPTQLKVERGKAKGPVSLRSRKASNNMISRGYLSGESTDTSAGSMRSSDTEVSSPEAANGMCPGTWSAWLAGSFAQAPHLNGFNCSGSQLRAEAEPFVPTTPSDISNIGLLNVISKLSPEDAATVVASLNAAHSLPNTMDASANSVGVGMPVLLYPHPPAMHPRSANNWEFTQHSQSKQTSHHQNLVARNTHKKLPQVQAEKARKLLATSASDCTTLKENLRELSSLDPKCVLLVRKISKLGLNSPQLLEIHFSQFGPVQRVLISHSIEKPVGRRLQPRFRPAALGFIAMSNAEDAAAALQRGGEHVVLGMTIAVGTYKDHFASKADDNEEPTEAEEEIQKSHLI